MEGVDKRLLHPSCSGGVCCEHPCGPVYRHQPTETETTLPEEEETEEVIKLGRFRRLGQKIISALV